MPGAVLACPPDVDELDAVLVTRDCVVQLRLHGHESGELLTELRQAGLMTYWFLHLGPRTALLVAQTTREWLGGSGHSLKTGQPRTGDGTVYLVRTRNRDHCNWGSHTKLVRYPVGGPAVVRAKLPDGRDATTTFALDETGGSTAMYFDRFSCRNGRGGIYRISDADTAGP